MAQILIEIDRSALLNKNANKKANKNANKKTAAKTNNIVKKNSSNKKKKLSQTIKKKLTKPTAAAVMTATQPQTVKTIETKETKENIGFKPALVCALLLAVLGFYSAKR